MGAPKQQPSSGNWFVNATSSVPAIASMASTSRRWNGDALSRHRCAMVPGTLTVKVRTLIGIEARARRGRGS